MRYGDNKYAGWKLAEYEGSGSYQTLIANIYNKKNEGNNRDTIIHYSPLSILRGGYYYYSNGNLDDRGSNGFYWEGKTNSETYARYLHFASTRLLPQYNSNKGDGYSIRCVVR